MRKYRINVETDYKKYKEIVIKAKDKKEAHDIAEKIGVIVSIEEIK